MASFVLGVLVGMAIEGGFIWTMRKMDRWIERMKDLPDVIDPPHPCDRVNDEVKVLKSK
tara:strand:+ start:11293 stop:11469 length:177 start_codon:yes stop_codon:yes gene_type:complete